MFAKNVQAAAGDDSAAQVRLVLWRTMQREPIARDIDRGLRFLAIMRKDLGMSAEEALRSFCLLALNLNEFIFLD